VQERGVAMAKFLDYKPEQAYLLPPSVSEVLGADHLCFFVRRVVAKLNLNGFRDEYGEEGGPAYAPEMLVTVWLYVYALGSLDPERVS
jgi:transposase